MAMVTARRGQHTVRVSKHSYETLFRNKGYRIVEDEKGMAILSSYDMCAAPFLDKLIEAGVAPDLIRLSVGIEDVDDIIADISQALGE